MQLFNKVHLNGKNGITVILPTAELLQKLIMKLPDGLHLQRFPADVFTQVLEK